MTVSQPPLVVPGRTRSPVASGHLFTISAAWNGAVSSGAGGGWADPSPARWRHDGADAAQ